MQRIERPEAPGWHAFRGYCVVGNNQLRHYEDLFRVEKMSYGKSLGVRLSSSRWRPVEAFDGEWYRVVLPWEDKEN